MYLLLNQGATFPKLKLGVDHLLSKKKIKWTQSDANNVSLTLWAKQ